MLEVKGKKTNVKNSKQIFNASISQKDLLIVKPSNIGLSIVNKSKFKENEKHSKKKNVDTNQPLQKNDNIIENVSIDRVNSNQLKQALGKTYQEIELKHLPSRIMVTKKDQKMEGPPRPG